MKPSNETIRNLFQDKALAGDGAFAIALALMDLVDAQIVLTRAIEGLELSGHVVDAASRPTPRKAR